MQSFKSGFLSSIPPVTKNLIIINILFWLATLVLPRINIDLVSLLGLHYFQASHFNLIQLVSYMFIHDPYSFTHVFFNMFSVYMFGRVLEQVWGSKRFLIYYIVTGIGAAIVQEIVWYFQFHEAIQAIPVEIRPEILNKLITIGASGAVFGILLAFGMLFPNVPLFMLFIPIPIKAKYFVIFYGILELFLGVGNFSGDNVAHFAHLGGMIFGYFLIKFWKKGNYNNGNYFN